MRPSDARERGARSRRRVERPEEQRHEHTSLKAAAGAHALRRIGGRETIGRRRATPSPRERRGRAAARRTAARCPVAPRASRVHRRRRRARQPDAPACDRSDASPPRGPARRIQRAWVRTSTGLHRRRDGAHRFCIALGDAGAVDDAARPPAGPDVPGVHAASATRPVCCSGTPWRSTTGAVRAQRAAVRGCVRTSRIGRLPLNVDQEGAEGIGPARDDRERAVIRQAEGRAGICVESGRGSVAADGGGERGERPDIGRGGEEGGGGPERRHAGRMRPALRIAVIAPARSEANIASGVSGRYDRTRVTRRENRRIPARAQGRGPAH